MIKEVEYVTNIEVVNYKTTTEYYNKLLDKLLNIKLAIKGDQTPKNTIEIMMVMC